MKYFIFRNNTVEPLFATEGYLYSGYGDISSVPEGVSGYIWFYQVPFKYDQRVASSEIDGYWEMLRLVADSIPDHKPLVIFTLADLYCPRFTDDDTSVQDAITRFNTRCWNLSRERTNVRVIDFSEFAAKYPHDAIVDWKYYFISQTPINPRLAGDFRKWLGSRMTSIRNVRKKCLVMDLDNTLWGGILGEDGADGIKIGGEYPGKAYLYFQEAISELSKSGVILAVCSKNNESDVLEAWNHNPYIVIKQDLISSYRINWNNKADNIREIALELNIGLDSLVFIDDNPTERELVRQVLPEVSVPDFPEQPYNLPIFFQDMLDRYFRVYSLTEEDRGKTQQYKENAERAKEKRRFSDMTDYLRSLQIRITLKPADDYNIERISQMTQKTNQFNLTTRRYTVPDLEGFLSYWCKTYCIGVSDRFGDSGITGAIMLSPTQSGYDVDNLLLSCRILGKGIEKAFVKKVLNLLHEDGVKEVTAKYIPTAKNSQVSEFYESIGFLKTDTGADGSKKYNIILDRGFDIEDYYMFK